MVDIGRATSKWAQNAARAGPDYQAGVQGKGSKWLNNAVAGEQLYGQRIQEAVSQGRRAAGIQRAGATAWEQGAIQKGAANFQTGVASPVAQQKYTQNFGPVLSAIQSAAQALPPRGPPMSAQNLQRAQAIWAAANQAAAARRGGGGTYTTPTTPTYGGF